MMKARCNDSIKRLITSSEYHYDDGMTVEQRFNSIPSLFEMPKVTPERYAAMSNSSVEGIVVPDRMFLIPFGFIVTVPKGFDRAKSSSSSVDIALDYRLEGDFNTMLNLIEEEIDWSAVHNNLNESILLGRAVYSWVQETHSCNIKRETESHLPIGDYGIQLHYLVLSEFDDSRRVINWISCPTYVKLTVVSKKANKNNSQKKSSNVDPEETVESLLNECDNMK